MTESTYAFYEALLGPERTLDDALNQASERIAEIGARNSVTVNHVTRRDGVASTKLYDVGTLVERASS
ncbi:hypothetical protein [Bordetella sp. N]|uniref:hypothetical protein n=1 Tax=Bordetella sp. N TaxID=1746199 RepID=UPI00070DEBFF|nr:hypothetical protein [Bordetella sp. N]ALM81601.1 hypothetical protein ASB57_00235 [Bordetella sp. N]